MTRTHAAHDCLWVEQTLDLPLPDWLDAWNAPWTCHRDPQARRLLTTDECAICPRWELSARAPRDPKPRTA